MQDWDDHVEQLALSAVTEDLRLGEAALLVRALRRFAEWAPFGARVIWSRDGRSPYLLRVTVVPRFWRFPAVFLHMFFRGDDDVEHHNHPWLWSASLVIAGGYVEERLRDSWLGSLLVRRVLEAGQVNVIVRDDFHRILVSRGQRRPWTLFVAGPRVREAEEKAWGFKHPATGGYEHWRKHVDDVRSEREVVHA
jgi:hypothetical protein